MSSNKDKNNTSPKSISDFESIPTNYNEQPIENKKDQMPQGNINLSPESLKTTLGQESKAGLRIHIEKLLQRREAAPVEDWKELGEEATTILIQMLDDATVKEAMRQRVIATLGQTGAKSSISPLGNILLSPSESSLNRTYAANALGNIADPRVVSLLGSAAINQPLMVRRQVVRSLGRINQVDAVPYLLILGDDTVQEIANLAVIELHTYEERFGLELSSNNVQDENVSKTLSQTKLQPSRENE